MTCQKISEILQGSQLDDQSDIFIAPAPGIWVLVPPPPIPTGDHPSSPPPCRCTKCTDIHNSDIFLLFNFLGKIPSQPFPQVIFHVKISDIFHLINIPMSNSSYVRQGKFQVRFFGHFLHAPQDITKKMSKFSKGESLSDLCEKLGLLQKVCY